MIEVGVDVVGVCTKEKSIFNRAYLKALATLRGATTGCEYAESFVLLKEIV